MSAEPHNAHVNAWVRNAARFHTQKAMRDGFKPEALHNYTDLNGIDLYWRIRLRHPDTGEKWIRPMRREGSGFTLKEPEFPNGKPLYRLHELIARPNELVILVEGEKCVDALIKAGALATTSGAADSVGKADWRPLAGRTVTIWPDNDDAGQRYAHEAMERLRALGCNVGMIDVASLELPHKGDGVDWLASYPGAAVADISTLPILATAAGEFPPQPTEDAAPSETDDDTLLRRLANMSPIEYDRARKSAAKTMGVRPAILDKSVSAIRKDAADDGIGFEDVEAWPDPVQSAQLLTDIAVTVRRFIICQDETARAVALWAAMTWLMDVVQVAPLAVITAPEKRCGKSQLLFLLGRLVHRPLTASNISSAALFRSMDAWRPTLLVDEADSFMRENEELRGLLNCGHTRDSAYIVRVVGEDHTPKKFNVWGAKALAGIGHLADTLMDRSITLELRRKLPHEQVDRLRYAEPGLFDDLAAKLARFAEDYSEAVRTARPDLPANLNDRAQDNWEPLLAIADVAGGRWPEWGRAAALKLSGSNSPTESVGTELLSDIKEVFDNRRTDRISTVDMISALCADDEAPWSTYNRGKPISPRQIAKRLHEYGIRSKTIRIGYETPKGFERDQFEEAFARYLSSDHPPENFHHTQQSNNGSGLSVAGGNVVAATHLESATHKSARHKGCCGVAASTGDTGQIVEVEL